MTDRFVSKSAANGYPAGNDSTVTASALAPSATIARAVALASDGDNIYLNDETYSEAGIVPTKSLSFLGVTDYGATFAATSGNGVIAVGSGFAGKTLTIGKIVLDGNDARIYGVDQGDAATLYNVTLNGTRIRKYLTHGVSARGTSCKLNFIAIGVDIERDSGATCSSGYFFAGIIEGSVYIDGGRVVLARQAVATFGLCNVLCGAANIPVTVKNVSPMNMALETGLTGTSTHLGLRIINAKPALADRNTITVDDSLTSRNCYPLQVSPGVGSGGIPAAQDMAGALITNNTVYPIHQGGIGILLGQDGTTSADTKFDGSKVQGNRVYGSARSEASGAHGILGGYSDNLDISGNYVERMPLSIALKGSTNSKVFDNIGTKFLSRFLVARGAKNCVFSNNTGYIPNATYQGGYFLYSWADTGPVTTDNVDYKNNQLISDVALTNGPVWVENDSSTSGFSNNGYFSPSGLGSYHYQGTAYASLALWKAAHESVAFFEDPMLLRGANDEFYRLRANSPMRQAGVAVAGVNTDFTGLDFPTPPPVGAMRALRFRSNGTIGK